MRKCIISLFLVLIIVFSTSMTVFADSISTEEIDLTSSRISMIAAQKIKDIGAKIKVSSIKYAKDLDNNTYAVVECMPKGYFIYHLESGICTEYNLYSDSPYANINGDAIYCGPTYYFEKENNTYRHIVLEYELNSKDIASLTSQTNNWQNELSEYADTNILNFIEGKSSTISSSQRSTNATEWVEDYLFFTGSRTNFGYVSGGKCGYIAANLILKYWDDQNVIDLPTYSSTTGLTNALYNIGADAYGASTTGSNIASVMNTYCRNNSLPVEASWDIGINGVAGEIVLERPAILFGNISNYSAGNHAVVVYGFNETENPGYFTYVCHFGWNSTASNDYTSVHISGATGSVFGTNTQYAP